MVYRTMMLAAAVLVLAADVLAAPGGHFSAGPSFHTAAPSFHTAAPRVMAAPGPHGAGRGGSGSLGSFLGRTPSTRSTAPSVPYFYPYYGGPYGYGFADDPYFSPFYLDPYFNDSYFGSYATPWASRYGEEDHWSDRGNVQLQIDPKDVQVEVDGIPSADSGRAALNLPTGKHEIVVTRRGYRPWSITLDVQQGVRYRLEQKLERLPKEEQGTGADQPPSGSRFGELRLNVQPSDAIVDLDGRLLGMADLLRGSEALRRLPPGHHTLRFTRAGYRPIEREIDITPDRPAEVKVTLEKG